MTDKYAVSREKTYSAVKTRIFLADLLLTAVSLFVFQVFLSYPVDESARALSRNFHPACFVYMSVFFVFMYVMGLPLRFFGSFTVEHRFGLSNQRFPSWLIDEAKSAVLTLVISMSAVQLFYLVLRNYPSRWWIIAAFLWVFFLIVIARLLPVIIIPLFFRYIPISDQVLKERIRALGQKAGIRVLDVCQIDLSRKTKKANAALIGLGRTRKVILADTLTDRFTPDEVEAVVAHEFGHYTCGHTWRLIAFSGALALAGFFLLARAMDRISVFAGAAGAADLSIFPILVFLMILSGPAILPLQNLFSRGLEREADSFALDMTGNAGTFISVMRKLASMNLADTEPAAVKKIFFHDHPPVGERIRRAEQWRADRG